MRRAKPGLILLVAAVVICGTSILPKPAVAQFDTTPEHDYIAAIDQVVYEHFPLFHGYETPQAWARAALGASAYSLLALQAIVEIGEDIEFCGTPESAITAIVCLELAESTSLVRRSEIISEACPAIYSTSHRLDCLMNLHLVLSGSAFIIVSESSKYFNDMRSQGRALIELWQSRGEPPIESLGRFAEFQNYANLDSLIIFVNYSFMTANRERSRLVEKALDAVDQLNGRMARFYFDLQLNSIGPMEDQAFRLFLEELYLPNDRYLGECLLVTCRWLEYARSGRVATRLPAVAVRPSPSVPDLPSPDEPVGPRDEPQQPSPAGNLQGEDSSTSAPRRPPLWVEGGPPIFLPRGTVSVPDEAAPWMRVEVGSVERQVPLGLLSSPGTHTSAGSWREGSGMLDELDLVVEASRTLDRVNLQDESVRTRFLRRAQSQLDLASLAMAIALRDEVRVNTESVGLIAGLAAGPVAGLPTVILLELSGFDDALATFAAEGGDVDAVMQYGAEVAGHVLSPFSLGKPLPYSQIVFGIGRPEPLTDAQRRRYAGVMGQASEDAQYEPPCDGLQSIFRPGCLWSQ